MILRAFYTLCICFSFTASFTFAAEPKLKKKDVISLVVFGQDSLTTTSAISSAGYVSFPLIGNVKAEGRTPSEVALAVKSLYEKDYLKIANVTISVEEYEAPITPTKAVRVDMDAVTILGQVRSPGLHKFPAKEPPEVLTAIAMAGGFTELANPKRVTVTRKGTSQPIRIDATKMQQDPTQSFKVKDGDIITISKRLF